MHIRADEVFEATVSACGNEVVCRRLGELDMRTLEANLLNFVISTSLTLSGEEPLHATVVELDGHAVGLLGHSGTGKSTLAAFLISRGADPVGNTSEQHGAYIKAEIEKWQKVAAHAGIVGGVVEAHCEDAACALGGDVAVHVGRDVAAGVDVAHVEGLAVGIAREGGHAGGEQVALAP